MKKTNLDEMQELKLLKIEHNAYWFCFTGLLAAIAVQTVLLDDWRVVAGEWIVFMLANFYVLFACMRAGIWDRRLKSDPKTNLILSLLAGGVLGAVLFFTLLRRGASPRIALLGAAFALVFTAVLCFVALQLSARAVKKRQAELDAEPEEE
ncbi:MAG: hypothetical protein IKO83_09090 [Oscillospiraceae bacterium]|nr:hypothetical protein [Oscillospiraceae bacterium]